MDLADSHHGIFNYKHDDGKIKAGAAELSSAISGARRTVNSVRSVSRSEGSMEDSMEGLMEGSMEGSIEGSMEGELPTARGPI